MKEEPNKMLTSIDISLHFYLFILLVTGIKNSIRGAAYQFSIIILVFLYYYYALDVCLS